MYMSNQFITAKQGGFDKAIEFFKNDIANLRTGRANPAILDGVQVPVYGSLAPLNTLANINVADSASLVIAPWDKNIIKEAEKAIIAANLGVSVVNEGERLRVSIPPLTEENRLDLAKKLGAKLEAARVEIRRLRDDVKTAIEKSFAAKDITEDDKFRFVKELDEAVAKQNEALKDLKDKKEKEIMTI